MENTKRHIWKSPFLILSLLMLIKIILLRIFLFEDISLKGLGFDLAFILVIASIVELVVPKKLTKSIYWSINLIISIICFIAVVYFEYFGSIIIYTSLFQAKQAGDVSASIKALIKPQDFIFFVDFIVALLFYATSKKLAKLKKPLLQPLFIQKKTWLVLAVVCVSFTILSNKLDKSFTNELVRADQLGILNYELNTYLLRNHNSFSDLKEATAAIAQAQTATEGTDKLFGTQKGKNLIVVQLEAFQNFPINLTINNTAVTPVLNNLAKEGYYFPHIFQQIGQGNTSDAEFMSNTSIYPTGTIAMSTGYGDRDIPSLPKLLEKRGYEADTFHVNDVTFWDRIKLYPALGFTHFFDKPFYNNDNFNTLGASDVELYRVGLQKLTEINKQNKPFYAQFITLSSHHPFKIPVANQNEALRDSLTRSQLGDYLLAINYTDYALGTFIDGLKKAGLWENSVLVVYGDHFGLQPNEKTNTPDVINKAIGIKYDPDISRFNIPLFIHVPNSEKGEVINQVGGQMDIMPTISNLLGISLKEENFVHFGQDLMNITKNVFGMRYYMPTGSFFNNDIMFVPGKGFEDGKATSLTTLEPVADFSKYKADYDYVLNQMKLSDDYVNMLPKR